MILAILPFLLALPFPSLSLAQAPSATTYNPPKYFPPSTGTPKVGGAPKGQSKGLPKGVGKGVSKGSGTSSGSGGLGSVLGGLLGGGGKSSGGSGGLNFGKLPAAPGAAPVPMPTVECSAVHFVVGRGSGEPQGVGFLSRLVSAVGQQVPGVTSEGIVYPAGLDFSNILSYVGSESDGVNAGRKQIEAYVRRCPQSKIVVAGVSQGADVAGSALCGGGSLLGLTPSINAVSDEIGSHVVAVVLFGDPRFVKGMPWNRGDSTKQGIIPHTTKQLSQCKKYTSRMRSFCDTGDPFCDGGSQMMAHAGVLTKHSKEAIDFIVEKIKSLSIPVRPEA